MEKIKLAITRQLMYAVLMCIHSKTGTGSNISFILSHYCGSPYYKLTALIECLNLNTEFDYYYQYY